MPLGHRGLWEVVVWQPFWTPPQAHEAPRQEDLCPRRRRTAWDVGRSRDRGF